MFDCHTAFDCCRTGLQNTARLQCHTVLLLDQTQLRVSNDILGHVTAAWPLLRA